MRDDEVVTAAQWAMSERVKLTMIVSEGSSSEGGVPLLMIAKTQGCVFASESCAN
jgi:hypothetical protein